MGNKSTTVTVGQLVRRSTQKLQNPLEAELLVSTVIKRNRAWLFAHPEHQPNQPELDRLGELVTRRAAGTPIAYLLGSREFYGRELIVNPDVLIPRPETELVIDRALQLPLPEKARVLDIGTGSGCIILTFAAERRGWQCSATDISQAALAVAQRNQARLELQDRSIKWMLGHLYEPLESGQAVSFDLIASNPPYVANGDPYLSQGDLRFEPDIALVAGEDGLQIIRELIDQAPNHLNSGGWLMIEHGYDQSEPVTELMHQHGFQDVQTHQDLAGINRIVTGCWKK